MNAEILVVDDETTIADLVEVYLKNEGYTVHKFYNGTDALDCVQRQNLDLAILDVMLPAHPGGPPVSHYHADGTCRGYGQDHGADPGG